MVYGVREDGVQAFTDIGIENLVKLVRMYKESAGLLKHAGPFYDRQQPPTEAASAGDLRLLRPARNQFDGTTLMQRHDQRGNCRRMSSMVELVVAVVALVSACIFLAHAIEAYRA